MEALDYATFEDDIRAASAYIRAGLFAFVYTQFLERPDNAFVATMLSDEFIKDMEEAAGEQAVSETMREGLKTVSGYLRSAQQKSLDTVVDELGVDRTRLYRGLAANYGPRAPYETLWLSVDHTNNTILQELADEYAASGKSSLLCDPDRRDYLGIELKYYTSLIEDEVRLVLQKGDIRETDKAKNQLRVRQKGFLTRHLLSWVPFFIETALPEARTGFYRGHLLMLKALLDLESELFTETEVRI